MLRGLLYVSGDSEDEVDESKSDALLQQQHVMTPNANNVLDPAMEITNQSNVLDSDLNGCTACDKRTPSSKCVPNNDSNAKCTSSGKHLSIIDDDKHPGVSSRLFGDAQPVTPSLTTVEASTPTFPTFSSP